MESKLPGDYLVEKLIRTTKQQNSHLHDFFAKKVGDSTLNFIVKCLMTN